MLNAMKSTFKILFYLKKNAPKKNGLVPVMVRITIDGTIAQFSAKLDMDISMWDTKMGRAKGRTGRAQEINLALDHIRLKINRHYQEIYDKDGYITAQKVKNAYLGFDIRHQTLLSLFARHNEDFERQVGTIKSRPTYLKYRCVFDHLKAFLNQRYKQKDIHLKELTAEFITEFELYLRTQKKCSTNTVWIYMMPLKRMMTIARNNGWITRDPFAEYRLTPESPQRGYLTLKEIKVLMNEVLCKKQKEMIRDLFIFCCFTGLSYRDLKNLTTENLQTSFDGHNWLITKRQKTGVATNIRLLDIPLDIIKKYEKQRVGNKLFRVPAYSTVRMALKGIAAQCGIEKNVTWHVARHTYATVICLTNGVPIETVSAMLGHRNIRTTQIYAKITNEKVSRDMEALSEKLQPIQHFLFQNT